MLRGTGVWESHDLLILDVTSSSDDLYIVRTIQYYWEILIVNLVI